MDKTYRIIFSGLVSDVESFKRKMLRLGVTGNVSEGIIKKAPVILKQGLSLKDARAYADAVIQAGGKTTIQAESQPQENQEKSALSNVISLKSFTMCPQCGYKQLKTERCIRCGFVFDANLKSET
jgi:hypothetical protein